MCVCVCVWVCDRSCVMRGDMCQGDMICKCVYVHTYIVTYIHGQSKTQLSCLHLTLSVLGSHHSTYNACKVHDKHIAFLAGMQWHECSVNYLGPIPIPTILAILWLWNSHEDVPCNSQQHSTCWLPQGDYLQIQSSRAEIKTHICLLLYTVSP